MAKKNGKPGPKGPNPDLMELAVQLRVRGLNFKQVARLTGVAYSSLMEWQKTPEWELLREKIASGQAGRMTHLSFELLAQTVADELGKKPGKRDVSLAKWWIERNTTAKGNDDGEGGFGGFGAHPGVVFLPLQNKGLESKPATQVLLQPAAPAPVDVPNKDPISMQLKSDKNPVKTPRPRPGVRRRVAGPDE